jgi:hypothetical protein
MVIALSSVGDIISISLLVKDLVLALNDARGSSAEYQAVVRELHLLDISLLQVEKLTRVSEPSPQLSALYDSAKGVVEKCGSSVKHFIQRLDKYSKSLATGGSGSFVRDATRKVQWKITKKDEEIAKFRAEITGYTESINMLLATAQM